MNAFSRGDFTPLVTPARAASAIIEWIEMGGPQIALDLAISSFGATYASGVKGCELELFGIEQHSFGDVRHLLKEWCGSALRAIDEGQDGSGLNIYFQAFGSYSPDRFHDITLASAKLGLGSWVDPHLPAQRITSHLFEIEMLGVLGRGENPAAAINNWQNTAIARLSPATAGVAA